MHPTRLLPLIVLGLFAWGCGPAADAPGDEPAASSGKPDRPWPADLAGDDRPSVVALDDGQVWLAAQSYDGELDSIVLQRLGDDPSERLTVARCADHAHGTALALDGTGLLHVVWSEHTSDGFVLKERLYAPGEPAPDSLDAGSADSAAAASAAAPDAEPTPPGLEARGPSRVLFARSGANLLDPRLAADPAGLLLLVCTRLEGQTMALQAMSHGADDGWSAPIDVQQDGFSNWAPALCAWGRGRFAVVWDSAVDGDYDVLLAEVRVDAAGPAVVSRRRMTDSPRFEAHASVAAAGERLYVAYETSPPGWGREGSVNKLDEALHAVRKLEIMAIESGRMAPLAEPFMASVNTNLQRNCEKPVVHVDGNGNLLLAFRGMPLPPELQDPESKEFQAFVEERAGGGVGWRTSIWFSYITRFNGKLWSFRGHHHEGIPGSNGRSDEPIAFGSLPRGGAVLVTLGDGREREGAREDPELGTVYTDSASWWRPVSYEPNRVTGVRIAKGSVVGPLALGPWRDLPAWREPSPADAPPDVTRRLPDGRELQLALGDLHRHTDLSRCSSNWDGPFTDAARYAFDVGGLQFLAVTDHFEHMTGYEWWRNMGEADAWNAPGRMVDLRAYERTDAVTGHRNVISGDGELPVIAYRKQYHPPRDAGRADRPIDLWPFFKGLPVLTIPHTPAGMFPGNPSVFDWLSFEPTRDRLVEIFQGYRGSSEVAGGPRAIDVPQAPRFVRAALDGGLHFGFIASSDHQSSYGSFAGVWTTGLTRAEIFEALFARRTFAATARMSLWAEWNGVPMGTAAVAPAGPTDGLLLQARAFGRELALAELIVDGRKLRTVELHGDQVERRFNAVELSVPEQGSRYAYVRVRTTDGELGWTSPIRLTTDASYPPDGPEGRHAFGPRMGHLLELRPDTGRPDPLWQRWEGPAAAGERR